METLEHAGVSYIKVTTLAKKYKYTADYIGQLCRAGKVDCQLVGRAWFVNEASLLSHKTDRYKQSVQSEVLSKINLFPTDQEQVRTSVRAPVSKHIHKHFETRVALDAPVFEGIPTPVASTIYSADQAAIHLEVISSSKRHTPEMLVAESRSQIEHTEHISIKNDDIKPIKLTFSPLPEVSLRGNIVVKNLDTEDKFVNSEIILPGDFAESVEAPSSHLERLPIVKCNNNQFEPTNHSLPSGVVGNYIVNDSVLPSTVRFSTFNLVFLPLVILVSLTCSFALLSFSRLVVSDGFVLEQSWKFNVSQAITAVSFLFEKAP